MKVRGAKMKTANKDTKWLSIFQMIYLIEVVILLITMWVTTDKAIFLWNCIMCTGIAIFSMKFDTFQGKYLPILTKKFKWTSLNVLNWFLQTLNLVFLLGYGAPVLKKFASILGLVVNSGGTSYFHYFIAALVAGLLLIPYYLTVTLPKVENVVLLFLETLGIVSMYLIAFMAMVDMLIFYMGVPTDTISEEPVISVFFFVIPLVYANLIKNKFSKPSWLSKENFFSMKSIAILTVFFIVIFMIDSAVWLHPMNTWKSVNLANLFFSVRSGVGEEFIFRILVFSFSLYAFKKYQHGVQYAVAFQAVIFGGMHLINLLAPGTDLSATIASTIDAFGIGVLFAVLYLVTKNLTLIVGIHIIWDLLQSVVTGDGNMSVNGLAGFAISLTVCLLCVGYSYFLFSRNKDQVASNAHTLINVD